MRRGRVVANSRYVTTSRYGPSITSRPYGGHQSELTAPDQSLILTSKEQPTLPEMTPSQPYRTSAGPRTSISRCCPPQGSEALVRPDGIAPDPLLRQQELFRKHRESVAAAELQRGSSSRHATSDWSVVS